VSPARSLICVFALAGSCAIAGAAELREVEFRDGTRLPLELNDLVFSMRKAEAPDAPPLELRLSDASEIQFSSVPPFERGRQVLRLIRQLGADDFGLREQAVARLREIAGGFESTLQNALETTVDPDLDWRMQLVLRTLAPSDGAEFDTIISPGVTLRGEIAPWSATAVYRGATVELSRKYVRAIRQPANPVAGIDEAEFRAFTKPPRELAEHFPNVIDFETAADGTELGSGESVEDEFVRMGVRFSTSIGDSYVGAVKYVVEGGSGDQAAATIEPLFHGTVSARFHPPGSPNVAAGVRFVSCRLAVVERGGTALVAFNAFGDEIGRATVEAGPHAYLGVASDEPIARVAIVPDPDLDTDYTFDDFTFSRPEALIDAPHPKHFTLKSSDGARIVCRRFNLAEAGRLLTTRPAAGFPAELGLPLTDVTSIMPATGSRDATPVADNAIWGTFADGSTVLLERGKRSLTVAGIDVRDLPLLALWSAGVPLQEPRAPLEIPQGGVAMLLRADPEYLSDVQFEERAIVGRREDDSKVFMHYGRLPTVWFQAAPENHAERLAAEAPGLLAVDGRLFRLGAEAIWTLLDFDADGIALRLKDYPSAEVQIPWEQIATLDQPASGR